MPVLMLAKRGVKFVQRVTSPHTDSPCLCDRVFGPVHQMLKGNSSHHMLKGNSFQLVKLLVYSLLGSMGTSMIIYQSAVSNVTTEGKEPFPYPYGILIFQVSLCTPNHRNVELWLQVENKHLFTQLQEIHPAGIKC